MDPLALFIPLAKADAAQRLVYGHFDETPDRSGEVCDYATAKPAFQAWSDDMAKTSDGKSLGNIRGQHSNIAAGKLIEITFDDDLKKVGFVAKVVDDNEWLKVEEGVYTGFSPGGRYAKRWKDGAHTRYTPDVRELSIVDVPCNPAATFTMVKADGAEEERAFVLSKAYEPGNEATVARADELAKAANGKRNDFVVQARAELIAENAAEALKKAAEPADPVAALDAALAKAAEPVEEPASTDKVILSDLAPRGRALALLAKSVADQPVLAKSLYTLERVGCLLERVGEIAVSVAWEEKSENDTDSKLPQMAVDLVSQIKAFLIEMANEETAELLASVNANMPELTIVIPEDDDMELASQIVDLVKADTALMEKAGKRNSAKDQGMIQTMHDHSVALGAECSDKADKDALAHLTSENDRMAKALTEAAPKVEQLVTGMAEMRKTLDTATEALAAANAKIDALEARPEMAKGVLFAVDKAQDGAGLGKSAASLDDIPTGVARTAEIERLAREHLIR